ncbi:hypothetical protein HOLleu_27708 [Holothuria leucospilota]|uniref:Uncharacterized protein n=1 Tax=Holothuria leucospilota TaxID=206669 RepID=A0A9Q1H3N7_HOLLE|nr:hypothetical protein HOLleu_27708 [Holothuria leucospilota]
MKTFLLLVCLSVIAFTTAVNIDHVKQDDDKAQLQGGAVSGTGQAKAKVNGMNAEQKAKAKAKADGAQKETQPKKRGESLTEEQENIIEEKLSQLDGSRIEAFLEKIMTMDKEALENFIAEAPVNQERSAEIVGTGQGKAKVNSMNDAQKAEAKAKAQQGRNNADARKRGEALTEEQLEIIEDKLSQLEGSRIDAFVEKVNAMDIESIEEFITQVQVTEERELSGTGQAKAKVSSMDEQQKTAAKAKAKETHKKTETQKRNDVLTDEQMDFLEKKLSEWDASRVQAFIERLQAMDKESLEAFITEVTVNQERGDVGCHSIDAELAASAKEQEGQDKREFLLSDEQKQMIKEKLSQLDVALIDDFIEIVRAMNLERLDIFIGIHMETPQRLDIDSGDQVSVKVQSMNEDQKVAAKAKVQEAHGNIGAEERGDLLTEEQEKILEEKLSQLDGSRVNKFVEKLKEMDTDSLNEFIGDVEETQEVAKKTLFRRTCWCDLKWGPYHNPSDVNNMFQMYHFEPIHKSVLFDLTCRDMLRECRDFCMEYAYDYFHQTVPVIGQAGGTRSCHHFSTTILRKESRHIFMAYKADHCQDEVHVYLGEVCCWKCSTGERIRFNHGCINNAPSDCNVLL